MALGSPPIISLLNLDPPPRRLCYLSFPSIHRFQLWNCNLNNNNTRSSSSSSASGAGISSSGRGGGGKKKDSASRDSSEDFLRKPVLSPPVVIESVVRKDEYDDDDVGEEEEEEEVWVDWEDQILENTAPLVGFVRMVLHSGKYESGERLSEEHENTILERILPYHPDFEKKIGSGIEYITIGYHPNFESSRCLFIARKDGEIVDISYWKCIKGLIKKKYPLYADTFILRHFRHPNNQQK